MKYIPRKTLRCVCAGQFLVTILVHIVHQLHITYLHNVRLQPLLDDFAQYVAPVLLVVDAHPVQRLLVRDAQQCPARDFMLATPGRGKKGTSFTMNDWARNGVN